MGKDYLSATFVAFFTMSLLDGVWIGVIMRKAWMDQIQRVQGDGPNVVRIWETLYTYAAMIGGVMVIAVPSVRRDFLVADAVWNGAVLGFFTYSVFDGTNRAVFRNYSWKMAGIDILWGTFLYSVTCLAASAAGEHWRWVV